MLIQVFVKSIENVQLQLILDYYNSNKNVLDEPIELLDRCEGGFQIKLAYMKNQFGDPNKMCKQVRWKNGYLVSNGYISFTYNETVLLYKSLCNVLGNDNVNLL